MQAGSPDALPVISVLLPVRNGEKFLAQALRSMQAQTFTDFELLLLDDGSTDRSVAIAQGLADSRIKIISDGQHQGLVHRLNQGVAMARGRFIARMDADDVSFPERFARQVDYLSSNLEVDLLGCRAVVFRGDGDVIGLLPFAATHAALCARRWSNIPLPHPGWMGRREWFLAHAYRVPDVVRAEDQELLLRACAASRYACLPEILLGYRQGDFSFRRTWVARKSLLGAQLRIFMARGEWFNLARALAVTSIKVALDALAALPGAGKSWFFRMGAPVDAATRTQLAASLSCGNAAA